MVTNDMFDTPIRAARTLLTVLVVLVVLGAVVLGIVVGITVAAADADTRCLIEQGSAPVIVECAR